MEAFPPGYAMAIATYSGGCAIRRNASNQYAFGFTHPAPAPLSSRKPRAENGAALQTPSIYATIRIDLRYFRRSIEIGHTSGVVLHFLKSGISHICNIGLKPIVVINAHHPIWHALQISTPFYLSGIKR